MGNRVTYFILFSDILKPVGIGLKPSSGDI
jgi:hypothetical protein